MASELRITQPQVLTQTQTQPVTKSESSIYRIAAKKLVNNAPLLLLTTVAMNALASLPMAMAEPCDDTHRICVRTCMTIGGPDPRETGACLIGCKLAYWVCIGSKFVMGWG